MKVVRTVSRSRREPTCPDWMSLAFVPPTSGVKTSLDSPKVPWHETHFDSQTCWPFSTLPEPTGSPLKSGRTSMSQALTSAGVAGRPTPG